MNMLYETERLRLEILTPSSAREVLDFQLRNRELFTRYEPSLPENFYSVSHQQALLKCELKLAMKLSTIRFYVFRKDVPPQVIGTVCLHNVTRMPYSCCEIGYKFDRAIHHRGYAREAVARAVSIAFLDLGLHRVFARVVPENISSIRLLESLQFAQEGLERSCTCIQGVWTDHLRYAQLSPYEK